MGKPALEHSGESLRGEGQSQSHLGQGCGNGRIFFLVLLGSPTESLRHLSWPLQPWYVFVTFQRPERQTGSPSPAVSEWSCLRLSSGVCVQKMGLFLALLLRTCNTPIKTHHLRSHHPHLSTYVSFEKKKLCEPRFLSAGARRHPRPGRVASEFLHALLAFLAIRRPSPRLCGWSRRRARGRPVSPSPRRRPEHGGSPPRRSGACWCSLRGCTACASTLALCVTGDDGADGLSRPFLFR